MVDVSGASLVGGNCACLFPAAYVIYLFLYLSTQIHAVTNSKCNVKCGLTQRTIVYTPLMRSVYALILHGQKCFQRFSKSFVSTACISGFVWKRVPDGGSGDRECSTAEYVALVKWNVQLVTVWCAERSRWPPMMSQTALGVKYNTATCLVSK